MTSAALPDPPARPSISAIIPTIGRPNSLRRLLESISTQTLPVAEVIVADASGSLETRAVLDQWRAHLPGVRIQHVPVAPPNAVRQREAAISRARGTFLFMLDDDVWLTPTCLEKLCAALSGSPGTVAATAMIRNCPWPEPTRLWRLYLRYVVGVRGYSWQGRVLGPLLRFGYSPPPPNSREMEWLATGTSLVRRSSFVAVGGFSHFFLHRSTTHEDVDLGIKLARLGRILLVHDAFLDHNHDPIGRVSVREAAADDVFNRFMVMRCTQGRSLGEAWRLIILYVLLTAASEAARLARTGSLRTAALRTIGMLSALRCCFRATGAER